MFRKRRPEVDADDASAIEREPARGAHPDLTIAVSSALERLTPEQREAVVQKVYEGFKFEEMAEILGTPVSTIKSRLYTALDLLKTDLAPSSSSRGIR